MPNANPLLGRGIVEWMFRGIYCTEEQTSTLGLVLCLVGGSNVWNVPTYGGVWSLSTFLEVASLVTNHEGCSRPSLRVATGTSFTGVPLGLLVVPLVGQVLNPPTGCLKWPNILPLFT